MNAVFNNSTHMGLSSIRPKAQSEMSRKDDGLLPATAAPGGRRLRVGDPPNPFNIDDVEAAIEEMTT